MISIERLAFSILRDAVRNHVTDIHIVPRKKDTVIQFRYANHLVPRLHLPLEECDRLISHFKFTASMDIGEKRKPQSGSHSYEIAGQSIGLRFSTLPSRYSESLVIRILPQAAHIPFYQISLFPHMTLKMLALLKHAHGLIIFTGPTGSGKTTMLYSLLNETSHIYKRSVITLEDPIEKEMDTVLQVQVNEKAGVTYSSGLKAILRHDPDIIMVGEIRDGETAKIAVRAALTGHLVLTTMHTRDANGAIYRLAEFGVDWLEIEQTLVAVTAQRLVELTCPFCGPYCSIYCYSYGRWKRASVFEFLSGKKLKAAMQTAQGRGIDVKHQTLKDVITKGIALGYIKESEYERWILDDKD
ncbi:competence protein ComGA [Cytobacillus horneckiae]|uniref:competence type IV pilus ATPase ComGA n=1 Tax=Cytobacillus horneckiae TaxID=549687 RepID=UPI0019CF65AE|nr:competence type IV pilus ATPase ComGA [Cytobacillus horneckiae]MBN6888852.1 type II/IV secretion system protein [Cytobacillus horneckiae]MCM3179967.1 GspE/PulE family protein [Cytobacillus horneckiae]